MTEKLKPCPACGGDAIPCETFAACGNRPDCCLVGPSGDPAGAKWNALPRRTDASRGMSDGELIARAIVNGLETIVAMMGALKGHDMMRGMGDRPEQFAKEVAAELDRRAAARKESE